MRWARLATPSLLVGLVALGAGVLLDGHTLRASIPGLKTVVAAAAVALLLYEQLARRGDRGKAGKRDLRDGLLIALAITSIGLHTHFGNTLRLQSFHRWEFFNHFVGGKYFEELGYTRLYDCVTVADALAGEGIPLSERPVRRLVDNSVERGTVVLEQSRDCPSLFTPDRWQAFLHDVAFFRSNMSDVQWARLQTDHGNNASPAWLMVGGALANTGPATLSRIRAILWLDPLLLAAMGAIVAWAFGWRVLCVACIYFGTLAPGDVEWIGRSFLRYDWLLASVAGVALLSRSRYAAAGVALTLGALLRVIPGFLIASLLVGVAAGLVRSRSPRIPGRWWRFAAGCVATIAVVVPLSSLSTGGFDAWAGFAQNSRLHLEEPLLNFMGWPMVVSYEHGTRLALTRDESVPAAHDRWQSHRKRVGEQRVWLYWLGVGVFVALLVRATRRSEDWVIAVLGVGLLVVCAQAGAYYYVLLLLYALLWPQHPVLGTGLCGLALVSRLVDWGFVELDEIYAWTSLAAVVYVLAATAIVGRRPDDGAVSADRSTGPRFGSSAQ